MNTEREAVYVKALLVTTGSRGDVEPFVALAGGLRKAGHAPTLAAPARFAELAETHDIAFVALDDSLFELQDELARQGALAAVTGARRAKPALRRFLLDVADLAEYETDVVVYHPKTLAAPMAAERQGVPAIAAQLLPLYQPTYAFPAPLLAHRTPHWLNRATWPLVGAIEAPWCGLLRDIRRNRLGLTTPLVGIAERIATGGVLNAWSPHLLPAPAEWREADAPLGFWRLPPGEWHPPQLLVDFLAAGEAPIYVGFGSMRSRHPAVLGATIRDGLRRAGRRGIVVTDGGAVELESSDDVLVMEHVPHDWLLPQVSVAVHHGGVGTVAAALSAGVPQVVKPFLGDQPFWARRVQALGVGTILGSSTTEGLADAIARADGAASDARRLAQGVAQEDGIGAAVARIERTGA